jgi:hypothetical protein
VWETFYASSPIMPFRLFAVRNFWVANWIMFWGGFGMTSATVYLPVLFQLVYGEDATQSGISLIPLMLSFPFGAMITGVSTAKTGVYRIQPLVGAAILTLGSGLFTTFTEDSPIRNRIGFLIIAGLSFGLIMISPMQTAQAAVLGRDRAITTSTVSFFNMLGRLCATAAGQAIFNNNLAAQIRALRADATAAYASGAPWSVAQQAAKLQHAYLVSLTPVFYLGVAGGIILFLGAVWCQHIPLSTGHAAPATSAPAAEGEAAKVAVRGEALKDKAAPAPAAEDSDPTLPDAAPAQAAE